MIDTASSPFESNITVGHHTPFPVEGGGSQRTGSNEMPLGPKKPIGTSWPTNLPLLSKKPDPPKTQRKPGLTTTRDHTYERKVWNDLQQTIKSAVEATAAHSKPFNGQNDRGAIAKRVNDALDILRPMILGGTLLHSTHHRHFVADAILTNFQEISERQ